MGAKRTTWPLDRPIHVKENAMRNASVWSASLLAVTVIAATPIGTSRVWGAGPETFAATATVKAAGGGTITAPVTITITRWTTDAERTKAMAALKTGPAALKTALDAMPATGTIQIGDRPTPLRYARTLATGGGKLVIVVAPQPILHLGAGVPDAKPKSGYDFAFVTLEVDAAGKVTTGDLAPAAKLKTGTDDAVVVDDYGVEAVRLSAAK
jgi:hypothetical protein